ncbi:MAG: pilus assembly protein [Gammaproteobacteria bacterium]|nr:pilus assembly protein [Gammaproteobacteria bacterium]MDE0452229.1 pilus assembly protein [Gammaproteobacteria bacterium]
MTAWRAGDPSAHGRRGSAAVEFVVLVPFILVLSAAIWDLRVFTAYRTDVAREIFVVAELIANGGRWTSAASVEHVIEAAADRLAETSAGVLHVAVVVRGSARHDGTPCVNDNQWCAPIVTKAFFDYSFPTGTGECGTVARTLPDEGNRFDVHATVLPFENVDPDGAGPKAVPSVDEWVSRNMAPQAWWIVVDSCSHFGEGPRSRLIGRRFMNIGLATLNVSPVMQRRSVWVSIDDLSECVWC